VSELFDYVKNPTIVVVSFSSSTSLWWEVLQTDTYSILSVYLVYIDVNTLFEQGYFTVGLLDAQWGRSAQKSHIFVRRNKKIPQLKTHIVSIMVYIAAFKSRFFAFTSFLDGTTYSPSNNIIFSQECILQITDSDVASFPIFKAYGEQVDIGDDCFNKDPPIACASMLIFYKKAISLFMTHQRQQWDNITHSSGHQGFEEKGNERRGIGLIGAPCHQLG
jgi:hypothetical protein